MIARFTVESKPPLPNTLPGFAVTLQVNICVCGGGGRMMASRVTHSLAHSLTHSLTHSLARSLVRRVKVDQPCSVLGRPMS